MKHLIPHPALHRRMGRKNNTKERHKSPTRSFLIRSTRWLFLIYIGISLSSVLRLPCHNLYFEAIADGNYLNAPPPNETHPDDPKSIQQAIETEEKSITHADQRAAKILNELDTIARQLNKRRLKASAIARELDDQTNSIRHLTNEKTILNSEILRNKRYLTQRLRALYQLKMGINLTPLPPKRRMIDQMIRHQALTTIVKNDLVILKKYRAQWDALTQLEIVLKRTIEEKKQLDMALFDEMWELAQQERAQQTLLEKIRNEKFLHIAAVAALQQAQTDLNERLRTINRSEKSQIKKNNGSAHAPSSPFHEAKGTLNMPVRGKIITYFGRSENNDNRTFTFQSGIDISTHRGEPVKSIFRGTVVYSKWLKSYGNVIIIDHGNGYYTLYAHLDERFKQKGTRVNTDDVIATAGDTGSLKGVHLHFEVRHHDTPVNPMKWLKKGA